MKCKLHSKAVAVLQMLEFVQRYIYFSTILYNYCHGISSFQANTTQRPDTINLGIICNIVFYNMSTL